MPGRKPLAVRWMSVWNRLRAALRRCPPRVGGWFAVPRHPACARPPATRARFPDAARGRPPTLAETGEITAAVEAAGLFGTLSRGVAVTLARVSRLGPDWAFVALRPVAGDADPAIGVVHRSSSGWVLGQVGTYQVGRGVVPPVVLAEFGLDDTP
jgi:hypothetical protein